MKRFGLTGLGIAVGFCAGLALLPMAHGADSDSQSAYQALDRFGQAFAKFTRAMSKHPTTG
jgi:hypothetical protein